MALVQWKTSTNIEKTEGEDELIETAMKYKRETIKKKQNGQVF